MSSDNNKFLGIEEICSLVNVNTQTITRYVEYGIIEPTSEESNNWIFDIYVISTIKKAHKLEIELDVDISSLALVLELLQRVDTLKTENKMLRQRLSRFINE